MCQGLLVEPGDASATLGWPEAVAGLGQQGQGVLRGWQQDGKSPAQIPSVIASPQLGNVPVQDPAARVADARTRVKVIQTQHFK